MSIFSSQGSVVLLLVVVLLMENRRRGMFFTTPMPMKAQVIDFARKYHGYLFSWAAIYTFWYHPMLNTSGHLIGFFYMFLILVQGSLFLTRAHTNRVWTLCLELLVAVHGTLVAIMNSGPNGIWPMFLFGFLAVFVITQMHGVGWSRRTRAPDRGRLRAGGRRLVRLAGLRPGERDRPDPDHRVRPGWPCCRC